MNFEKVKSNLESNGFKVTCFETSEEATNYIDSQNDNKTIGFGGSMTLEEMDLYNKLSSHNKVSYHGKANDGKTSDEVRMEASVADVYISSVNGLAQTGEIINIDGLCNRVSSVLYGHKKVYLVVGKNKIAPTYDAALWRARNIAAPLNAKRLGKKTPCAIKADRCYDCKSPERICCGLTVLLFKPKSCEYEVILVNENLGY